MGYSLGIDLGTTFTAAAVFREGRAEIANLGERASAVPSVVFLNDDDTILVGVPAERRAVTEPGRVAREFKRRFGDTTPIFLGGSPLSADVLTAKVLKWVYETVVAVEGSPPDHVALTYPANWGPYKRDLLDQAVRVAGLQGALTITEPEAAATYYATTRKIDTGQVIGVYDLGGGTFDAAILKKTADGFVILGKPEGIERLGGIDFDAAVYTHVTSSLGKEMEGLDPEDPATLSAVARLRIDCVEAKEALSTDTEASIPVMLPHLRTEVRLTRSELEEKIRPTIAETVEAMRRALLSANRTPEELAAVLLVGGSSRIPLVADMLGKALGRPIAIDTHPKHSVALGAAIAAASTGDTDSVAPPPPLVPAASRKRPNGLLVGGLVGLLALVIGAVFILPNLGADPAATPWAGDTARPTSDASTSAPTGPVSELCGTLITRDTVITEPIRCDGEGLTVAAAGVTIDLGGQTVTGTGDENSTGIRVNAVADVTIINGTVTGFARGLVIEGGATATIDSIVSNGNVGPGLLVDGEETQVSVINSSFTDNDDAGVIFGLGTTFAMSGNVVSGNGFTGITVGAAEGTMDGDTIEDNAEAGILVNGETGVADPRLGHLTATGLLLSGNLTGVAFLDGGTGSVSDSVVTGQVETGVRLRGAGEVLLDNNQIESSARGIWLETGVMTAVDNMVIGNQVGIEVGGGEAVLRANQVTFSTGHGFVIGGGSVTLTDNAASQSGGSGFEFSPGTAVTDGGGNTSTDNASGCSPFCPISLS